MEEHKKLKEKVEILSQKVEEQETQILYLKNKTDTSRVDDQLYTKGRRNFL